MLSKSQAKAFFIIGTAAFSAIFIGLTIDTFQRIPKQTNANALTESSIRGKHLFDKKIAWAVIRLWARARTMHLS